MGVNAGPERLIMELQENEFAIKYQLQVTELNETRNAAELLSSVIEYLNAAFRFGEKEAFRELYQLQEQYYLEFLQYNKFNYPEARRNLFAIVNKYELNRERLAPSEIPDRFFPLYL